MKVKIITEAYIGKSDEPSLEDLINDFIKDKKVIDIKYQSNCSGFADSGVHATDYERSALIMYEETADKPVVEKLKEEKVDLDEKIRKLKAFLNDDEKLSNIGKGQVNLLRCQLETMEKYSDILWSRIINFEGWG
ncbi:crAss001_48 related protein [uncultured Lactobacillus sp.]|uniref:crAss001_48 related protein n=1 Tax=uncultured Lactobacillus sp. TaxID=153152 RepID=UPI002631A347|nr:hypothetical protein [uncultured Lactobacillus sp.]